MDDRPIGVFDSGLGGLTTVRELCRLLPEEDIVYFGDTGRVPYGSRSRETIVKYARQDVAFLRTFDLKTIVIACGTVSTTALDVLAAENPIPVLGVVAPAGHPKREHRPHRHPGVHPQRRLRAAHPGGEPGGPGAGPALPPLCTPGGERPLPPRRRGHRDGGGGVPGPAEGGGGGHPGVGLHSLPPAGALCLPEKVIGAYMGPEVRLINSGAEGARAAADCLRERDALAGPGRGSCRCFVSDRQEDFSRLASTFLGWDVAQAVEQVDISQY